ncbi:MAG: mucoidy inhibitor MuiA family protein [Lachnospiraceae bacterium]|nr:mucoidy inhibitor MuiA family protein [Lachnospiraceae bacterium]
MVLKSKATEVSVYRNSVSFTRVGSVALPAGRSTIFIQGMSKTAKSDSFSVKFPTEIHAVNIQVVSYEETGEDLESEKIAKELSELNYNVETYSMLIELRKKNGDFSSRKDISVEDQEKYLESLPEKLFALHETINKLNAEKEKIGDKLKEAEAEEEKPLIMVELECEKEGEHPFILQYQESSGNWEPKYEVRFTGEGNPLDVYMKAKIIQCSGEDWKQVKVTLYTGNPSASQSIPSLPSVKLSIYEPPVERVRGKGVMMDMAAGSMAGAQMMAAAAPMMGMGMMNMEMMKTAEATVSEEETMTAFELPDLRDLLSDTDGNIASLQSFKVDAKYNSLCIPCVKDTSFLTATITSTDWPLPAATAAIYLKEVFAGNVYVNPDSDEETFILSLGQDERLNVIRKELPCKTQDVFLKNQKKKSHEYAIKITNKSSESIKVLLKDSIPVSTDNTIVVDASELSGGVINEENGVIDWEITVADHASEEIKLAYTITWPKDKQISRSTDYVSVSGSGKKCPSCGASVSGKFCPVCGAPAK